MSTGLLHAKDTFLDRADKFSVFILVWGGGYWKQINTYIHKYINKLEKHQRYQGYAEN